ncbi:hypothetical protein [Salinimicrobium soli]|uniref:hypothetical protein n=1 Tax=Salinimicrobium soli TaxID=1254399 RepID=UPI003AB09294
MDALRENLIVTGESGYNFTESSKLWLKLKARHKDTYQYSILEISVTNLGGETTISVEKGKVLTRSYEQFMISEEDGSRTVLFSFTEDQNSLGSNSEGAPPKTIDELYETCLRDYMSIDPDRNTIYFDTNKQGVISLCGYVPDLCQDDCFVGFEMSHFSWGN